MKNIPRVRTCLIAVWLIAVIGGCDRPAAQEQPQPSEIAETQPAPDPMETAEELDRAFDTDDDVLDPASEARDAQVQAAQEALVRQQVNNPVLEDPPAQEPEAQPYELKGDQLGMSLREFKQKHHRLLPSDSAKTIPWCSDERPGQDNVSLLAEAWHANANIVNCRLTMPYEDFRGESITVAGVETKLLLYHFVDERMYQITIWINHAGYIDLRDAAIAKYGDPTSKTTASYQNSFGASFDGELLIWDNGVSSITLAERFGQLDTSAMIFVLNELLAVAKERAPGPNKDDL